MRELLTQEALAGTGCADPGCDNPQHTRMVLIAECHPNSGTIASYEKRDGTLTLSCAHCYQDIATFLIAPSLLQ